MVAKHFVCCRSKIDRFYANIKNEYADMSNGKKYKKYFDRKSKEYAVK